MNDRFPTHPLDGAAMMAVEGHSVSPEPSITVLQAVAVIALWQTHRFLTSEIAQVLYMQEADVDRVIHSVTTALNEVSR